MREKQPSKADPPEALPSATRLDFVDSFEGDKPAQHWTVKNEDPNGYIVENGAVYLVTSKESGIGSGSNAIEIEISLKEGIQHCGKFGSCLRGDFCCPVSVKTDPALKVR